ncbi:MAG: hypothetical protein EOP09_12045 [Proteobacteria bacterium]|nr:MAG: hypothetical protein EOP09_12045 [Pseudomonadota bacterium]
MTESSEHLDVGGFPVLRYAARLVQEKKLDIGYSCLVGDKSIRVFPNNRVEIADIEYLDRQPMNVGESLVQFIERPSWVTQYPEALPIETVKASLDYAFILAGLPSLFYLTNLSWAKFSSREEERRASLSAYKILYPVGEPWITELNHVLEQFARDLEHRSSLQ